MRISAISSVAICIFLLSSCKKVDNEFTIHDQEGEIFSAELRLCGKRLQLAKSEGKVRGTMAITCEGAGSILISLSNGSKTTCPIGYVTPGIEQTFEFAIKNGQCR
jgi:hypothetical protein